MPPGMLIGSDSDLEDSAKGVSVTLNPERGAVLFW